MLNTMVKFLMLPVVFLAGCVTPLPENQKAALLGWVDRAQVIATELKDMARTQQVRDIAGQVSGLLTAVKDAANSGNTSPLSVLIKEARDMKPVLIAALRAQGTSEDAILGMSIGITLALDELEKLIPPPVQPQ